MMARPSPREDTEGTTNADFPSFISIFLYNERMQTSSALDVQTVSNYKMDWMNAGKKNCLLICLIFDICHLVSPNSEIVIIDWEPRRREGKWFNIQSTLLAWFITRCYRWIPVSLISRKDIFNLRFLKNFKQQIRNDEQNLLDILGGEIVYTFGFLFMAVKCDG